MWEEVEWGLTKVWEAGMFKECPGDCGKRSLSRAASAHGNGQS